MKCRILSRWELKLKQHPFFRSFVGRILSRWELKPATAGYLGRSRLT